MSIHFAYFYFMTGTDEARRAATTEHAAYWRGLALPDFQGGPFDDLSGGIILFRASGGAEAERLVMRDPLARRGLVRKAWLKTWSAA